MPQSTIAEHSVPVPTNMKMVPVPHLDEMFRLLGRLDDTIDGLRGMLTIDEAGGNNLVAQSMATADAQLSGESNGNFYDVEGAHHTPRPQPGASGGRQHDDTVRARLDELHLLSFALRGHVSKAAFEPSFTQKPVPPPQSVPPPQWETARNTQDRSTRRTWCKGRGDARKEET